MQQLQPLRPHLQSQRGRAREVTVGPTQARDQSEVDWITCHKENDWNCLGRDLCRQNRRGRWRNSDRHLAMNKISGQCRQLVVPTLGPAIFDRDILAFDKSGRFQAQAECAQPVCIQVGRVAAHKPNSRQLARLLRPRRERPRNVRRRRTTESQDECTPPHSITSSARASSALCQVRSEYGQCMMVAFIYGFIPAHAASLTWSSRNTPSSLPPVNSCAESSHAGPLMRSSCIVASRAPGTTSTPPPSHSTKQRRPDAFSLHIPFVRKVPSLPRSLNCARNQYLSAFPGGGL